NERQCPGRADYNLNMQFLYVLFLVGCVSSNHLDHLLVYSHPDENSQQIQVPTTTIGRIEIPVEAFTSPAVKKPLNADGRHQHQHIQPLTTASSSYDTYEIPADTYNILAVTEANGVTTQEPNNIPSVSVTQLPTILTDTVTKTVTLVPGFSTLTITDFQTITAPATVLTSTVVERAPQSTVTVTYIQEAHATPLVYTVTKASIITVTKTTPVIVSQTRRHPTKVSFNDLRDKYATVTKRPLFFGKSADSLSSTSNKNEGEFLIIKPAEPIVSLNEAPSAVDFANDGAAKSFDNESAEELAEPIVSDDVTTTSSVGNENVAKSLDNDVDEKLEEVTESTVNFDEIPQKANNANENFAKILDNDTVEKLAEPIVSLDEVTPKNIVANEKVAKSLDTVAVDVLTEVTTINIPTVSTIKHTTAPFEFSSSTAPPTIAPAVGRPKALSFIEPEEV
ncbi:unnamed protein product, partial [Meganyctiphanes norvegica]